MERELVIEVERKLLDKKGETWEKVVKKFLTYNKETNWTFKTYENYESTIKAHTFEKWGSRPVRDITTGEIRNLINNDLAHLSESTRKSMLKYLNGAFNFAL